MKTLLGFVAVVFLVALAGCISFPAVTEETNEFDSTAREVEIVKFYLEPGDVLTVGERFDVVVVFKDFAYTAANEVDLSIGFEISKGEEVVMPYAVSVRAKGEVPEEYLDRDVPYKTGFVVPRQAEAGEYNIEVQIRDAISERTVKNTIRFTVKYQEAKDDEAGAGRELRWFA